MKYLPTQLHSVYEHHYKNDSQPGFQELKGIFLAIVQQFNCVFFVLDALDECTLDQRKDLCEFFAGTVKLSTCAGHDSLVAGSEPQKEGLVKLFVASRKESDIEGAFLQQSFPKIEVEAMKVDRDIELYVTAQIQQRLDDGSLTLNNLMLKDKILTALTKNAGGMYVFLFHYIHQNILFQISNPLLSIGFCGLSSS